MTPAQSPICPACRLAHVGSPWYCPVAEVCSDLDLATTREMPAITMTELVTEAERLAEWYADRYLVGPQMEAGR